MAENRQVHERLPARPREQLLPQHETCEEQHRQGEQRSADGQVPTQFGQTVEEAKRSDGAQDQTTLPGSAAIPPGGLSGTNFRPSTATIGKAEPP